jgi:polyhydroxybutyrate depolymerase
LYVPSTYRAEQPAPLIVALHGRFSSAQAFHAITRLAAVAEERGAIVVYPETLGGFWNDGGHGIVHSYGAGADDAGLVTDLIASVSGRYAIDPERVYLTGFDQGGSLAYRIACTSGARFAGVAIVSAAMWDYQRDACASAPATPILIIHGRRDEAVPARGGSAPQTQAERLSVEDTLAVWRRANGCEGRAEALAGVDLGPLVDADVLPRTTLRGEDAWRPLRAAEDVVLG